MSLRNNPPGGFSSARSIMAEYIGAYKPSKQICRLEVKIPAVDQLDWLSAQKSSVKIFGANQDDSLAIAGIGEALSFKGKGSVDFAAIFARLRSYLTPQYPYLQWYGGFCFDTPRKSWEGFGSWRFVLPRFELARNKDEMIFCCNLVGSVDRKKVLKELAGLRVAQKRPRFDFKVQRRRDSPMLKPWGKAVEDVLNHIQRRDCQKVVLARRTDLFFKSHLDPWAMLKSLKKVTPQSYHFAFQFGPATFLGASPERLYLRRGGRIYSEALAGTKPSSVDPQALLNSHKDRHEHHVVVEAIDRTLRPLCRCLQFSPQPDIKTLSNGHHLITPFEGDLKDGVKDEDILESLHPTPALGGFPRNFALQTIRGFEPFERGWYGGPVGYVGLAGAEFVVAIRSGLVNGKRLSVFAGAGIVEGSNPADEWREIENKISNFIKIIK